jgi:hypothetical protein
LTHPVRLSALAALDIQQAREWHDAREPGLGDHSCSSPLPPPSAAGFTQADIMFSPLTRPNRLFSGGGVVERNDA